MSSLQACVMCAIDPQTTSLVVPLAQATVIAVPIMFRREIAARVRRIRQGQSEAEPDADVDPESEDHDPVEG